MRTLRASSLSLLFCKASSLEWSRIISLLDIYEQASGQRLNKEKTSIFFSKNKKQETKDIITTIAGVRTTDSYEKYLGLPALIGRSRNKAFKGILDRVRGKLSNWKMKLLLSQAEKEILLKSVIQAIPTYSMRVFKLPTGLLQELNRLLKSYWWGQATTFSGNYSVARARILQQTSKPQLGPQQLKYMTVLKDSSDFFIFS
ncbi:hypothetical protein F2P56_001860 [Juglans regia]|uniref:Reverse transcriptase n=1 Tax=Juglans regia TaxID=51240 RepID=A0A834D8R1_JUGRE|nr:hypothetical protein F2P56_001860 [Juglans regia]